MKNSKNLLVLGILLGSLGIFGAYSFLLYTNPTGRFLTEDFRPSYCQNLSYKNDTYPGPYYEACIPPGAFENLPSYPNNMKYVSNLVFNVFQGVLENFCKDYEFLNCTYPDENYYKNPEFYPTWYSQGIDFYTPFSLPQYTFTYVGVSGFGAFPGDLVLDPIKPGQDARAVTYFITSWGVRNYQGLKLIPAYPASGDTNLGTFVVNQDPNVVKNYFQVTVDPQTFTLDRNWPSFGYNWSQKIVVTIHVSQNTPPGKYLIGFVTTAPDDVYNNVQFKKHGFNYQSASVIGSDKAPYRVFLNVAS